MAKSIFDGPLTKEEQAALRKFILHHFDFYKEHSGDKYIHHLVYIAVRAITRIIGVTPARWMKQARIAVITAEENSRLGSEWRDRDRPDNAYECLKIEVEDL
jgi:hypothetical protein